mgnify:CR=1 FL=1
MDNNNIIIFLGIILIIFIYIIIKNNQQKNIVNTTDNYQSNIVTNRTVMGMETASPFDFGTLYDKLKISSTTNTDNDYDCLENQDKLNFDCNTSKLCNSDNDCRTGYLCSLFKYYTINKNKGVCTWGATSYGYGGQLHIGID